MSWDPRLAQPVQDAPPKVAKAYVPPGGRDFITIMAESGPAALKDWIKGAAARYDGP